MNKLILHHQKLWGLLNQWQVKSPYLRKVLTIYLNLLKTLIIKFYVSKKSRAIITQHVRKLTNGSSFNHGYVFDDFIPLGKIGMITYQGFVGDEFRTRIYFCGYEGIAFINNFKILK